MARHTFLERVIHGYRNQPMRSKAAIWISLLVILLLTLPAAIRQHQISRLAEGRMYFATPQTGITPGQVFPVEVRVQTSGTPINAVSAVVQYNPAFLQVVNMTTENSFCVYYLDNTFDNIKGEVKVSCGVSSPGFQGDSIVVHLNMRAKAAGDTTVRLNKAESRVLANDGKGTDITDELPQLDLTVKQVL